MVKISKIKKNLNLEDEFNVKKYTNPKKYSLTKYQINLKIKNIAL